MAQIRKYQDAGKIEKPTPTYQKINADSGGEYDPEQLRTMFAQDPEKWFALTGANPKLRDGV